MNRELKQWISEEAALKSRRRFLLGAMAGGGMAAAGGFGLSLNAIAASAGLSSPLATTPVPSDYRAMVCFFLFGGNDTCNTVIPYDTAGYDQYLLSREGSLSRPFGITRLREDLLPMQAASLGGGRQLALPREMDSLKRLYDRGKVAVVANVGVLAHPTSKAQYDNQSIELPPQLFSHSDHQRFWQLGVPSYNTRTGWAGRMGDLLAAGNGSSPVSMCMSMRGNNAWQVGDNVLPYPLSPQDGAPQFWSFWNDRRRNAMLALNAQSRSNLMERQAARVFTRSINAEAVVNESLRVNFDLETLFPTPPGDLAPTLVEDYMEVMDQFRMVARMIEAHQAFGHRRQIFFVSLGGFDDHDSLADHGQRLRVVADGMAAFYQATALLGVDQNVVTFTASDFGRPLKSNGTGSDHGWGAHHFVVGGSVRGGNVYGDFPNLQIDGPDALDHQGHLLPSTAVEEYAATLASWFGVSDTDIPLVVPNIGRFERSNMGFMGGIKPRPPTRNICPGVRGCVEPPVT